MDFNRLTQVVIAVLHAAGIVTFVATAMLLHNPAWLVVWLLVCVSVLVQFIVFGNCLLNVVESPQMQGRSIFIEYISNSSKIPYEIVGGAYVVCVMYIPTLFVLWKLYKNAT